MTPSLQSKVYFSYRDEGRHTLLPPRLLNTVVILSSSSSLFFLQLLRGEISSFDTTITSYPEHVPSLEQMGTFFSYLLNDDDNTNDDDNKGRRLPTMSSMMCHHSHRCIPSVVMRFSSSSVVKTK
jgi:hypothetical protein